jgi:hypothetical protein
MTAAACANEKHAILAVEVNRGALEAVSQVDIIVSGAGRARKSARFSWSTVGATLALGVFLPVADGKDSSVYAAGYDTHGYPIACSSPQTTPALIAGQTSTKVILILQEGRCPDADAGAPGDGGETDGRRNPDGPFDGARTDASPAGNDAGPRTDASVDSGVTRDASGSTTWRSPVSLEEASMAGQVSTQPDVAVHQLTGNALVVWTEPGSIRARRYDAARDSWSTISTVVATGMPEQPQVGIHNSPQGIEYVVIWIANPNQPTSTRGLWWSRSSDGATWAAPQKIVGSDKLVFPFNLAMDSSGVGRVVWVQETLDVQEVWTAFFERGTWSEGITVGTTIERTQLGVTGPGSLPQVALDENGNAYVVWMKDESGQSRSVLGARFSKAMLVQSQHLLEDHTENPAREMAIASNAQGQMVLVWTNDFYTTDPDLRLWSRQFDMGNPGAAWLPIVRVPNPGDALQPAVVITSGGDVTAVWAQDDSRAFSAVWGGRLVRGQNWTVAALEPHVAERNAFAPKLSLDGAANVRVVWRTEPGFVSGSVLVTATHVQASGMTPGGWTPRVPFGPIDENDASDPQLATALNGISMFVFATRHLPMTSPTRNQIFVAVSR